MLDKVKELIGEVTAFNATTKDEIETFRIKFLSKKGLLNDLFDEFKNVAPAERKEFGQALNTLKNLAQDKVNELKDILENSSEQKGFYGDLTAFALFLIASFTDFLDGMLARMLGEESKLGELLDPIADKIIVATALILLVMSGTIKHYEVIAAIIILTREILISGLREFLAKGKIRLPVSNLAKLKTFLQMVAIALLLTGETGNKILNFQDYNAQTIGIILLWLSAFLTLYTGYEYLRKGIDHAMSEDSKN